MDRGLVGTLFHLYPAGAALGSARRGPAAAHGRQEPQPSPQARPVMSAREAKRPGHTRAAAVGGVERQPRHEPQELFGGASLPADADVAGGVVENAGGRVVDGRRSSDAAGCRGQWLEVEPQAAIAMQVPEKRRRIGGGCHHAGHLLVIEQERVVVHDAGHRRWLGADDLVAQSHRLCEHPDVGAGMPPRPVDVSD